MKREKGFTLLELVIVIAVIVTLAAIAIPSLLRSRMAANETACIGSLKTLATQQMLFAQQAEVDQDRDGRGEYGWLCELGSEVCVRRPAGMPNPAPLYTAYLSRAFKTGASGGNGFAEKSGYLFRLYLPVADPVGAAGDAGDDTNTDGTVATWGTEMDPVANKRVINLQESSFVCQAWPVALGNTGTRCFVVNETGLVYASSMTMATYNGAIAPMADYGLCYAFNGNGADGWWNDQLACGSRGTANDGNIYNAAQ